MKRLTGVALALIASLSTAAAWPERPVRVIVPFGPGGGTDILVRNIQKVIQDEAMMAQPIGIVNVPGHYSLGALQVRNAAPDGYTFLAIQVAMLTGEVSDPRRGVSYRDFVPVAITAETCLHPVVRADSPHRTLADVLAAARERPGTMLFGANIGGINHVTGLFVERHGAGARFRYVQIGGGAENFAALRGGHVQLSVVSASEYQSFKAGGLRALAYTGASRLGLEPDVATMRELGLAFDFCIENYWFAPRGTPQAAIDAFADVLERAMASAALRQVLERQASTARFLRGAAAQRRLDEVFAALEPVVREASAAQAAPAASTPPAAIGAPTTTPAPAVQR